MAWRKFKEHFQTHAMDETHFVLGVDIGSATSGIAYFDALRRAPELIDMSGGYGKPSMPTVLQYAPDTREWIFGEYAVLNRGVGKEQTFANLPERLGRNEYIEVNGRPTAVSALLGMYCKELVGTCKSLNPKAEIAGLVAAVPSYASEDAKADFLAAFQAAGFEKDVIALVPDRECIFQYHFATENAEPGLTLLLDFGSRELRGGIYNAAYDEAGGLTLDCVSSLFDKTLGAQKLNARVLDAFTQFYCAQTGVDKAALPKQARDQLAVFAYQHKDLLFQKEIGAKPVKLYYNFAYPPLQQAVSAGDVRALVSPFEEGFHAFLDNVFAKTLRTAERPARSDIKTVLCVGGGFEMLWARRLVSAAFPDSQVVFHKNAKGVIAMGASITAAAALGVASPRRQTLTDKHMLAADIGVKVQKAQRERFVPLLERNSFWWQPREPVSFLLNEPTGKQPATVALYTRAESGEIAPLGEMALDGLPERPAGTTKLRLSLQCEAYDRLTAVVADAGFGELFPAVRLEKAYTFEL